MVFFWNIASWDFIFEHLKKHHVISNLLSLFSFMAFLKKNPCGICFQYNYITIEHLFLLLLFLWMITVVCSMWSESDSGLLLLVLQCLQCIFYKYDIQPWWSQLDERKLIKSFFTYFVHFRHFGENFIIRKKTQIFIFSTNENTWVVFLQWPLCEAAASSWKAAQGDFLVFFVPLHHQANINRQTSWQQPPRWRREWWDERCTRSTTRTSPSMGFTSTNYRSVDVFFSQSLVKTRKKV